MSGVDEVPAWAITAEHPDPGVSEYLRPVGTVVLHSGCEEVTVTVIQRVGEGVTGEVGLSIAGMRLTAVEAELLSRVILAGVALAHDSQNAA